MAKPATPRRSPSQEPSRANHGSAAKLPPPNFKYIEPAPGSPRLAVTRPFRTQPQASG